MASKEVLNKKIQELERQVKSLKSLESDYNRVVKRNVIYEHSLEKMNNIFHMILEEDMSREEILKIVSILRKSTKYKGDIKQLLKEIKVK